MAEENLQGRQNFFRQDLAGLFLETAMRTVNIQEMLKTDKMCDLFQFLCDLLKIDM